MAKHLDKTSDPKAKPAPPLAQKPPGEPEIKPDFTLEKAVQKMPGLTKPVEGVPGKTKIGLKEEVERQESPTGKKKAVKITSSAPSAKKATPKKAAPKKLAPAKSETKKETIKAPDNAPNKAIKTVPE